MAAAPVMTPELEARLKRDYEADKSVSAFLVWNSHHGYIGWHWKPFKSMAAAYDLRSTMIETEGFQIEEFLVVNTFKKFEPDEGE